MAILEAVGGPVDPNALDDESVRAHTVAIAHDYITQRGGAERVVLSLATAFPGAPILTSLYDAAKTYPEFADLPISSAGIDRYDAFRRNHRLALPLLARSFSSMVAHADVVVCSSSGWAHGIQTDGRKVVYCHTRLAGCTRTTARPGPPASRGGLRLLQRRLVEWDLRAARSADRYLVNSTFVRERVRTAYGIDAEVCRRLPTLDPDEPQRPVRVSTRGFLLCVARLLGYKNVDAVVEAIRASTTSSSSSARAPTWRRPAPRAAQRPLRRQVSDDELRWLYANCSALVSASYEGFGLSPLEAATLRQAVGSVPLRRLPRHAGRGRDGLFFDEPTPIAINATIHSLLEADWDADRLRAHAESFSERRFIDRLHEVVAEEASASGGGELGGPAPAALVPAPHHGQRGRAQRSKPGRGWPPRRRWSPLTRWRSWSP